MLYSISLHGRTELGLAPDEYAALTMALLRLLAFKPQGTADAATVEKKTLAKPVTQAEAARIQAPAPAQASAQAVTVVAAEPVPAAPAVPEVAPVVPAAAPVQPPASVAPVQAPAVAPAVQYTASPIAAPAPAGEPAARATPAAADVVQAPAPVAPPAAPKATAVQSHAAPQPAQQPAVSNEVPPWEDIPEVAVEESDSSDDADSAPPAWEGPMDGEPMDLPDDPLDAMEPVDAAPAPRSAPAVQDYAPAPAPLEVPTTPLGDVWHGVVTQLVQAEAVTALVRELALQSQLVAQEGDSWTLRVERTSLNQATAKERLRKALADAGHCQTLVVENGAAADTPAKRNTAAAQRHQKLAEAIVLNDPQVQTLMRAYGAKIVPGSIRPA